MEGNEKERAAGKVTVQNYKGFALFLSVGSLRKMDTKINPRVSSVGGLAHSCHYHDSMFLFLSGATHLGLHAIGIHAVHPATATKDVGLSRSTLYLYFNKETVKFKGEKGPIKPRPL